MLDNQIDFVLSRAEVDRLLHTTLSDEQWISLASELDNNISDLIHDEILKYSIKDINYLVEDDRRYN
jgi:hypothetical protein